MKSQQQNGSLAMAVRMALQEQNRSKTPIRKPYQYKPNEHSIRMDPSGSGDRSWSAEQRRQKAIAEAAQPVSETERKRRPKKILTGPRPAVRGAGKTRRRKVTPELRRVMVERR